MNTAKHAVHEFFTSSTSSFADTRTVSSLDETTDLTRELDNARSIPLFHRRQDRDGRKLRADDRMLNY